MGFYGGSSMYELGSTSDMVLFFDCINYVAQQHPETNWSLINDRLYRRYLRIEELDDASRLMDEIKVYFSKLPSTFIDWSNESSSKPITTKLNAYLPTLEDVFADYFKAFNHCISSAKSTHEAFQFESDYIYQPVKIGTTDIPNYILDKDISLAEHDSLKDEPFWLQNHY